MANKALLILRLIIIGPIFALLIWIDRLLFRSNIRNPFLHFPRNVAELVDRPKEFFAWFASNCTPGTLLPRGAKFVRIENRGGAQWEPDKAVVKARIFYTEAGGCGKSEPQSIDIFCKMPTAREYPIFFKTLISTFVIFGGATKEVQFVDVVWPELNKIARARDVISKDEELFRVPHNLCAAWSRPFERSIAISKELDASIWTSRPDWKNADAHPQIATLMISTISRLHALTFDCMTPRSKHQPDSAVYDLYRRRFTETCPAKWIDDILSISIGSQPSSVQEMWAAIMARVSTSPAVMSHSDFRMGNQLFNSDFTDIVVTDWEAQAPGLYIWDVAYAIFAAFTPDVRRSRERELLRFYASEMRKHGIDSDVLGEDAMFEHYRIAQVMLHFFSWALTQFGGVGAEQGNSGADMKAWGVGLTEVVRDYMTDPKMHLYLRCDENLVKRFGKDCHEKRGLN